MACLSPRVKLLTDTKKEVSESYGSVTPVAGLSARRTFLIDPEGVIRNTYMDGKPATHSEEVLADPAELQK